MFAQVERYKSELTYRNNEVASSIAGAFSRFHPYRGDSPLVEAGSQRVFEVLEENFRAGWLRDSDLYAFPLESQQKQKLGVYITHAENNGYSKHCPNNDSFGCSENTLIFVDGKA